MSSRDQLDLYQTGFVTSDRMTADRARDITRFDVDHSHRRETGSKTVARLMAMYRSSDPSIHSWAFARQVVDIALKKFGSSPSEWFVAQYARNDYLYDTNLRFLDDTIKYVITGERDIQVVTWAGLVIRNPSRRAGVATPQRAETAAKVLYSHFGNGRGEEFFQAWIGKEGGIVDLLRTLDILFGASELPVQ